MTQEVMIVRLSAIGPVIGSGIGGLCWWGNRLMSCGVYH